uniref:Uncharacterized protein n=1 Tax=Xenopus tropicalis TaxID=8364 RepID=A0A1B8XX12_XENTR
MWGPTDQSSGHHGKTSPLMISPDSLLAALSHVNVLFFFILCLFSLFSVYLTPRLCAQIQRYSSSDTFMFNFALFCLYF